MCDHCKEAGNLTFDYRTVKNENLKAQIRTQILALYEMCKGCTCQKVFNEDPTALFVL